MVFIGVLVEGAINKKLISSTDTKCDCGSMLYITDDLIDIYCNNINCPNNIKARGEHLVKRVCDINNIEKPTITEEMLNNIYSPYELIDKLSLPAPNSLIELIYISDIYLISNIAKTLFTGYRNIREAIQSLTVNEIYNRLPSNKDYSYEVYKQIQKHSTELIEAEKELL